MRYRCVDAPQLWVPNTGGVDFLKLFGRPNRVSACECERTSNVSLAHALNLINGSVIGGAVVLGGKKRRPEQQPQERRAPGCSRRAPGSCCACDADAN